MSNERCHCQRRESTIASRASEQGKGTRVSSTDSLVDGTCILIPGCHFQNQRNVLSFHHSAPFLPPFFVSILRASGRHVGDIVAKHSNEPHRNEPGKGPSLTCRKQFESVTRSLRMGSKDRAFTPSLALPRPAKEQIVFNPVVGRRRVVTRHIVMNALFDIAPKDVVRVI